MKKLSVGMLMAFAALLAFTGCNTVGDKASSLSLVYGTAAILSLAVLVTYIAAVSKKDRWLIAMFTSVFVVNVGYFWLSVSKDVQSALMANRVSYLGSAFLPMFILMTMLNVAKIKYKKWLPAVLIAVGTVVFLIAASPGYSTVYYKEVSLCVIGGVTTLNKGYGPLHPLYFVYLLLYFFSMIAVIVQSYVKKKMDRTAYVVILAIAVFVNLGVWLIEQLVKIDFEMLSVSYIISELFLVGFHYVMRENEKLALLNNSTNVQPQLSENVKTTQATYKPIVLGEQERLFLDGVDRLTPTESAIYNFYIEHKTTKEIMAILCIKENTLKFHNKNIYGKLGVSSRKQLMELYSKIKALKERTE